MNIQHLDIFSGENRTLSLAARDSSNAVASLTSKTVAWYVGRSPWNPESTKALITKTGTVTSASGGLFTVALTPADTDGYGGMYEHMAITTDGSGNKAIVTKGRLKIVPALEA